MRREYASRRTVAVARRRDRQGDWLPLDPRDPDIVRVKDARRRTAAATTHRRSTAHHTP